MKMSQAFRSNVLPAISAFALGAAALAAQAQQYPAKPVRLVTPFPAAAGPEIVARLVGDKLTKYWGQTFVVENRPGANGTIAVEAVKNSPADGYTLVQMDDAHMSVLGHLYSKLPYNTVKDFEPVASLFRTYFFVVVPMDSPWKTVGDIIATAKAKGNALSYGSWGIGSPGHIGMAVFESMTGTQMNHVPYKDLAQLYQSVGNNDVGWAFGTAASAGPMYRAKKVKFVAIAAPQRLAGYTDVPTVAEAGGPKDFEVTGWVGLLAPRGIPRAVVTRINQDVAKALSEPDVRERLATFTFVPTAMTPEEMTRQMAIDDRKYAEVVKRAKISLD